MTPPTSSSRSARRDGRGRGSDFAGDLFRMYSRCPADGLEGGCGRADASPGDARWLRRLSPTCPGDGVFGHMKWESGVHRVQRVPATETPGPDPFFRGNGRRAAHRKISRSTSEAGRYPYRYNALLRGRWPAHVNTTDSACDHAPCDRHHGDELRKSQHVNREKAMDQLKIRLYEK